MFILNPVVNLIALSHSQYHPGHQNKKATKNPLHLIANRFSGGTADMEGMFLVRGFGLY